MMMMSCFCDSLPVSNGFCTSSVGSLRSVSTSSLAYGRLSSASFWALRIRIAEIICKAFVTLPMFCALRMRFLISRSEAIN